MTATDPIIVTALALIAITAIAGITAVLVVFIALRGTPGTRRAEIITAISGLVHVVRSGRR